MLSAEDDGVEEESDMRFSPVDGLSVTSMSCHQSNSTQFWMPHS